MIAGLLQGSGGWVTVGAPSYKGFRFPAEIIIHWCVQRKGWLIM
jgi:hypothetical protein